jgi:hypothetical protein
MLTFTVADGDHRFLGDLLRVGGRFVFVKRPPRVKTDTEYVTGWNPRLKGAGERLVLALD